MAPQGKFSSSAFELMWVKLSLGIFITYIPMGQSLGIEFITPNQKGSLAEKYSLQETL